MWSFPPPTATYRLSFMKGAVFPSMDTAQLCSSARRKLAGSRSWQCFLLVTRPPFSLGICSAPVTLSSLQRGKGGRKRRIGKGKDRSPYSETQAHTDGAQMSKMEKAEGQGQEAQGGRERESLDGKLQRSHGNGKWLGGFRKVSNMLLNM